MLSVSLSVTSSTYSSFETVVVSVGNCSVSITSWISLTSCGPSLSTSRRWGDAADQAMRFQDTKSYFFIRSGHDVDKRPK